MESDFLFKLYKRRGNSNIGGCLTYCISIKVTKILKEYAKLRKQVISLCCKIVVIIGYVKLIERRRNHECIR